MEGLSENIRFLCASSDELQSDGIKIYKPRPETSYTGADGQIEKHEFGTPNPSVPEKVIMMVGSTGSGKTTLINGMLNSIVGVEYGDPIRFKLVTEPNCGNQAKSQTCNIASYTIHHKPWFKVPYTLTIIDTPGFGDTSGIERDREIIAQIHKFFSTQGDGGFDHIDAVGFVIQSSLCRLTPTQRYIFDQILSLFGKDIKENIFLMLTFSDGQKPEVLSATKEADMPSDKFFKFNNSAVFAISDDEEEKESLRYSWNMGNRSFQNFMKELYSVQTKSLLLTKEVLDERNSLKMKLAEIQADIQASVINVTRLRQEKAIIERCQFEMELYQDFEYEVDVPEIKKEPTSATNLFEVIGNFCYAIGVPIVGPAYNYITSFRKEKRTKKNLQERYQKASNRKMSQEEIVAMIQKDIRAAELRILGLTDEMRKSLERLSQIALKPNPLSSVMYIDTLIAAENNQPSPGYEERVEQLQKLRKEAEEMQKLADRGYDPLKEYIAKQEAKNCSCHASGSHPYSFYQA